MIAEASNFMFQKQTLPPYATYAPDDVPVPFLAFGTPPARAYEATVLDFGEE
jgi:hypothetical protein